MGYNMRSRISSTANINLQTCGGNKKAGLPSLVGLRPNIDLARRYRSYPSPNSEFYVSYANVLSGGVGRERAGLMFRAPADGANRNVIMQQKHTCKYLQKPPIK